MQLIITIGKVRVFQRHDLVLTAGDALVIRTIQIIVDHRVGQGKIIDRDSKTDTSVDRRDRVFAVLFGNEFISCLNCFQMDLIIGIRQGIVLDGKASDTVCTTQIQCVVI